LIDACHELLDQFVERDDPVLVVAAIKQLRAACVSGSEVAHGTASVVLVLDALPALDAGGCGQRLMLAASGLDRGLLIAADDVVAGMQQLTVPAARVQVEYATGVDGELGVAGEDP
jgi:hypothetical protein